MILPFAAFVIVKTIDFVPPCVLTLVFGEEENFEYQGSTTP